MNILTVDDDDDFFEVNIEQWSVWLVVTALL